MLGPPETESPPVIAVTEAPTLSTATRLNEKNTTRPVERYSRERYWLHC